MTVLIWPYRQKGHTLCVDDSHFTPFDRGLRHNVRALLRRGQRNVVLDLARVSWQAKRRARFGSRVVDRCRRRGRIGPGVQHGGCREWQRAYNTRHDASP